MSRRRLQLAVAAASVALVLTAAAVSRSDRWNFEFAQYRGPERPEPKDEFRFVIVGDRTGGAVWGLMPQAFREMNHLYPDFVVSVGDLIDGYGDQADEISGLWKDFDEEVANLKSPFVYVPGNHDIWSPTSRGVYEQRYGKTFRSFNYRGLHFITLDTEEAGSRPRDPATTNRSDGGRGRGPGRGFGSIFSNEQMDWLKADIAANRQARRILIFMHKPVWLYGDGLAEIYPLLEGTRANIFAGHHHAYSYMEQNGIPHVVLGATAASMPEDGVEALGRFRGYVMATVRDDELKLAVIRLGGVMSPDVVLTEDLNGIRQLADACAIKRDGDGESAPTRLVFTNPLKVPVRVQIQRISELTGKAASESLFSAEEPQVAGGETLERVVDWKVVAPPSPSPVTADYRAVFRFKNSKGESQSIDYPVERRTERVATAIARAKPPSIDGDVSDWSDVAWQTIHDRSQAIFGRDAWKGPTDLSAQFALAEDDRHIFVAVRVIDDNVAFNSQIREGDSVELFAAEGENHEIVFSNDADWHRLVIAPFASGDEPGPATGPARVEQFGGRKLSSVQTAYSRTTGGYTIEIALPRVELGWIDRPGATHELDIAINDRDLDKGRETQLAWSGTDRNTVSSRYYGRVRLPKP